MSEKRPTSVALDSLSLTPPTMEPLLSLSDEPSPSGVATESKSDAEGVWTPPPFPWTQTPAQMQANSFKGMSVLGTPAV